MVAINVPRGTFLSGTFQYKKKYNTSIKLFIQILRLIIYANKNNKKKISIGRNGI
jgi:hypothetical protein